MVINVCSNTGTAQLKILQQMTVFAMMYSDKLRERTEEPDQTQWRIEPYGWDCEDRTYFLLDDNRLYRQSEPLPPPPPAVKPSKKTKAGRASLRKRRRTTNGSVANGDDEDSIVNGVVGDQPEREPEDNGIGGRKWECVVVTLDQLNAFLGSLRKSRDDNQKILRKRLEENLLPILEQQEASRKRRELAHERELLSLARMATAKRSSRLADKAEHQRLEQQARAEEAKRLVDEAAARKQEADALKQLQRTTLNREQRLQSRQDRVLERETRRMRHEQELAGLSQSDGGSSAGRMSQRRLMAETDRNKKALAELESERLEDDWIFACACGVYGQIDDGTHSISCERCNVWQHSACLRIGMEEADKADFHYVCEMCRRRERDDNDTTARPRTTIKIKLNGSGGRQTQDAAAAAAALPPSQRAPSSATDIKPSSPPQPQPSLATTSVLAPPMEGQPDDVPVIPVKKSSQPWTGSLPRPILTDITSTSHQTPAPITATAAAAANPLSSSPPIKLAPVATLASSPYLGPAKSNGPQTPVHASVATPMSARGGSSFDRHRGFPSSTPLGGSSPISQSISMAPLPPPEHGISPVKHSPPPRPRSSPGGGANGISVGVDMSPGAPLTNTNRRQSLSTHSPIVPPTTTLVPSPPPQINTPPHKRMFSPVRLT